MKGDVQSAMPPAQSVARLEWARIDLSREEVIRETISEAARCDVGDAHTRLEFAVGLAMHVSDGNTEQIRLCRAMQEGRTVGWVLFMVEPAAFVYALGDLTLFTRRHERLRLIGDKSVIYASRENEGCLSCSAFMAEAFKLLFREAAGRPCFLQALAVSGELQRALETSLERAPYRRMRSGKPTSHYFIDSFDDFASFVASLTGNTQKTARYYVRRITKQFDGGMKLRRFARPDEVGDFLNDAVPVSRETYQWRLGAGLRNHQGLVRRLEAAARLGWWRSYVLYVNGEAVSFLEGYALGGIYAVLDMGYRPTWARWNVGTVTLLESLREMKDAPSDIGRVDFLYGDYDYKKRYGNAELIEASYHLLPRTLEGSFTLFSLSIMNWISQTIGETLERLGWKNRVRTLIRHFMKHETEPE
jgi:GNAT acetyltransferase-like protein